LLDFVPVYSKIITPEPEGPKKTRHTERR